MSTTIEKPSITDHCLVVRAAVEGDSVDPQQLRMAMFLLSVTKPEAILTEFSRQAKATKQMPAATPNPTDEDRKVTKDDIAAFCKALTEASAANYKKNGYTYGKRVFRPSPGGRVYVRICAVDVSRDGQEHGQSAHCFVKIADGTLWKPDGWKGPAKNFSRGSVRNLPASEYAGR